MYWLVPYLVFMVLGIRNLVFGPLLFVGFTTVFSLIAYHYIESPLIDIGRRLSSGPARIPAALPAQQTEENS